MGDAWRNKHTYSKYEGGCVGPLFDSHWLFLGPTLSSRLPSGPSASPREEADEAESTRVLAQQQETGDR